MRPLIFAALALACAAPAAAHAGDVFPPTRTVQCLEPGGKLIPPVCQVPGSRIETRELICTCPISGSPVETPVCAKGETPPPEGAALVRTRRLAARDGSLVGDLFDGRQICAPARRP